MTSVKLIWQGPWAALHTLDMLLTEVLFPPAEAVTLLKDDAMTTDSAANWHLHAYFSAPPTATQLQELLRDAGLSLAAPKQEKVPDKDWVAHALAGLGVVTAGRFVLYGAHDAAKAATLPGLKLQVEANRAFGTGHHPTTAGCLEALSQGAPAPPQQVLDIGTGSGVLAMAARRLWPEADILATDIDAPSVKIAEENAALNGIEDIRFVLADGLNDTVRAAGPFDLILANILARPLIALAPQIAEALAPEGRLLLAGLLARQEAEVVAAYAKVKLEVVQQAGQDPWPVLILRPTS